MHSEAKELYGSLIDLQDCCVESTSVIILSIIPNVSQFEHPASLAPYIHSFIFVNLK